MDNQPKRGRPRLSLTEINRRQQEKKDLKEQKKQQKQEAKRIKKEQERHGKKEERKIN